MSYGSTPPPPPPPGPPPPPAGPPPQYGGYPATTYGQLALWPQRALGFIIDYAMYIPGAILMNVGGPKTLVSSTGRVIGTTGPSAVFWLGLILTLGVAIWNRWMKGGQGQTVGRKVAGVTLIDAEGQPIGTGKALLRDLAHAIDSLICYIGWLFPLWDAKRQTIADKIMNTTVVTVPKG